MRHNSAELVTVVGKGVEMKTIIFFLFLAAALFPATALAASGCPRGQDSCSDPVKKKSGFLSDVEAAQKKPPPASAVKKTVSSKPGGVPVLNSSAAAAAQGSAAPAQGGFSRPAWLLLVAGGLAVLYQYLKDGKRRGRKK